LRHIILVILGAVLLAGCAEQATFGSAITEGEPTPLPTPVIPSKPVYEVERGNITYERRFFGRITPVVSRELDFEIGGRVAETFVSAGDTVATGDILARLDTGDLEAQLLAAEEELAIAQSIFDSASNQVNFGKQRAQLDLDLAQLRLDYAISQASDPPTEHDTFIIDTRTIERDVAQLVLDELDEGVDPELRFDVTRAQNQVDDIQATINQAELVATMDGQLTSFALEVGDPVVAFETVAIIADVSEVEVTDELSTDDMSELAEGMTVTMQRAGIPDAVYTGVIVALPDPYGTGVDERIHVAFDEQPPLEELSLGDRMSFNVVIDERQDVLVLPTSAIRQFSGRNFVVVQQEGVQQRVDVRVGLEGDGQIEILEGVEENQTVIGP